MSLKIVKPRAPSENGGSLWRNNKDASKFNQCECCPYGYHIDLDFVRYCEVVSHRSDATDSKERRKERRRQRQSMEVLLGLTSPTIWNLEQQLPQIPQEPVGVATEATEPAKASSIIGDALHKAVQDFEDTLERTHKTPNTLNLMESKDVYLNGAHVNGSGETSFSSVSSPVTPLDGGHMSTSAAHDALMQEFDVASIGSGTSGLSHGALQNIRHQMAVSLERMRELEEQVKLIPILQVQLSVAREEKRKLSLLKREWPDGEEDFTSPSAKDKTNEIVEHLTNVSSQPSHGISNHNNENGHYSEYIHPSATDKNLALKSPKNGRKLHILSGNGPSFGQYYVNTSTKVPMRDVGLTCTVIKRDIDTMHRPIVRNASTSTEDMKNLINNEEHPASPTSNIPLPVQSHSFPTISITQLTVNKSLLNLNPSKKDTNLDLSKDINSGYPLSLSTMDDSTTSKAPLTSSRVPKLAKISTRDVSCGSNLQIEKTYTESDVKRLVAEAVAENKKELSKTKAKACVDIGCQFEPVIEIAVSNLEIIERRDVGTQAVPLVRWQDAAVQATVDVKRFADASIQARPRLKTIAVDATVNTRDYGSQKCFVCDKCDVEKRSIGIGSKNVQEYDLLPKEVIVSPPPVLKVATKSVMCSTNIITNASKFTDTSELSAKHDVGTITNALERVDASVGSSDSCAITDALYVCNKCEQKVTSEECVKVPGVDQESKIPRRTGTNETRLFKRQTTYTKLSPAVVVDLQDIITNCSPDPPDRFTTLGTSSTQSTTIEPTECPAERSPHRWETHSADKTDSNEKVGATKNAPGKFTLRNEIPAIFTSTRPSGQLNADTLPCKPGSVVPNKSGTIAPTSPKKLSEKSLDVSPDKSPEAPGSGYGGETSLVAASTSKSDRVQGTSRSTVTKSDNVDQFQGARDKLESTDDSCDTTAPVDLLEIDEECREKVFPSKKMQAALKVVNDSLKKSPAGAASVGKAASDIIQREWFQISSTPSADPHVVEDYLDAIEEISSPLLEHVVNVTDKAGNTAMHYALSQGNFDVVSILLDSKVCNINRPNAAGYTAVMLVSLAQVRSETHKRVLQRFLANADVNIRAKQHGQTALMLAVSHNRLDMVQLLIEGGADLNIQDDDGSTALMCAAEHGHAAIVQFLINQPDADQNIKDVDGSTALDIALDAGHKDVGILLYAHKHFSRNNSPHSSLRVKRSKSATPTARTASTPPPRTTPNSPLPVRARHTQE